MYLVCLCLGATGPLYAGYMLAGGYSWRLFFYVETAFAAALLILAFVFAEESLYHRVSRPTPSVSSDTAFNEDVKTAPENQIDEPSYDVPERKTFLETLKPWGAYDPESRFFLTMLRPFTLFFVPAVFWVITSFGIYIGLGALAFNYTFPTLIVAPPYNWSQNNSGLIAVGNAVGYLLAVPFTTSSDILAAWLTRRNNGIREAEMRLGVMLPAMLIAPAGLVVYAYTAQDKLHWIGYFFGVAMCNWGSYFYFSFTLAYAIDSYTANTSEMLIAMNLGKQAISFGMGLYLLDWVIEHGYLIMIAGIFGGVLLANNLLLLIFMFFGKKIRIWTSRSFVGRFHKRTAGQVMTH